MRQPSSILLFYPMGLLQQMMRLIYVHSSSTLIGFLQHYVTCMSAYFQYFIWLKEIQVTKWLNNWLEFVSVFELGLSEAPEEHDKT